MRTVKFAHKAFYYKRSISCQVGRFYCFLGVRFNYNNPGS